jgi:hypothetical protein
MPLAGLALAGGVLKGLWQRPQCRVIRCASLRNAMVPTRRIRVNPCQYMGTSPSSRAVVRPPSHPGEARRSRGGPALAPRIFTAAARHEGKSAPRDSPPTPLRTLGSKAVNVYGAVDSDAALRPLRGQASIFGCKPN